MTVFNEISRAIECASFGQPEYSQSAAQYIDIKIGYPLDVVLKRPTPWDRDGIRKDEWTLPKVRNGVGRYFHVNNLNTDQDTKTIRPQFLKVLKETAQIYLRAIANNWQECSEEERKLIIGSIFWYKGMGKVKMYDGYGGKTVLEEKNYPTVPDTSNMKTFKTYIPHFKDVSTDLMKHIIEKRGYKDKVWTRSTHGLDKGEVWTGNTPEPDIKAICLLGHENDLKSFIHVLQEELSPSMPPSFTLSEETCFNIAKNFNKYKDSNIFKFLPEDVKMKIEEIAKSSLASSSSRTPTLSNLNIDPEKIIRLQKNLALLIEEKERLQPKIKNHEAQMSKLPEEQSMMDVDNNPSQNG